MNIRGGHRRHLLGIFGFRGIINVLGAGNQGGGHYGCIKQGGPDRSSNSGRREWGGKNGLSVTKDPSGAAPTGGVVPFPAPYRRLRLPKEAGIHPLWTPPSHELIRIRFSLFTGPHLIQIAASVGGGVSFLFSQLLASQARVFARNPAVCCVCVRWGTGGRKPPPQVRHD